MAQGAKPDALWRDVVRLTEALPRGAAQAVRLPLYTTLKLDERATPQARAKRIYRTWRRLLRPLTPLPAPSQGPRRPLFGFFHSTSSNINNLLPVAVEAARRGERFDFLISRGIELSRNDFAPDARRLDDFQVWGLVPLRERLQGLREGADLHHRMLERAKALVPHLADSFAAHAPTLRDELASAAILRKAICRLLPVWNPSCIVSTSDFWPWEHTVFAVAREMNIPGFVIQHGVISDCWWPALSTKLLLWGRGFAEEMSALGAPPERLSVCGMPATDGLFARHAASGTPSRGKLDRIKCVILSNTQGRGHYPPIFAKFGAFLRQALANLDGVEWSVKLHPSFEDDTFYRELGHETFEKLVFLPKNTTVEDAVSRADVACTLFSTAGLEAMVMGKPLVVFDLDEQIREWIWWPASGGGVFIENFRQLQDYFGRLRLESDFYGNLVVEQNHFLDRAFANHGCSAKAIVDLIQNSGRNLESPNNDSRRGQVIGAPSRK